MEAAGIDKGNGKILKDGAKILAESISEIFSLSITSRIFPNDFKVVNLKPIFKKGKKIDPSTYFIVTVNFRIFEKVIHDQTNEFIKKGNLLHY